MPDMDNDIKIYFDHRTVILTNKNIKNPITCNTELYIFGDKATLAEKLEEFNSSGADCLYVVSSDIDLLFREVKACFTYIEAAGGLVMNENGEILFIRRLGKWDLPKGKAEKKESLEETAVREVIEECGLTKTPAIVGKLSDTYHTYHQKGKHILKHTSWYVMSYDGRQALTPQYSENITEAVWLPESRLTDPLNDTYHSIQQVLNQWMRNRHSFGM